MSKKSKNEYPSGARTNWKVVLTYLFVFALSSALFYYIFNLLAVFLMGRAEKKLSYYHV